MLVAIRADTRVALFSQWQSVAMPNGSRKHPCDPDLVVDITKGEGEK
jgi:hypothetical protein